METLFVFVMLGLAVWFAGWLAQCDGGPGFDTSA